MPKEYSLPIPDSSIEASYAEEVFLGILCILLSSGGGLTIFQTILLPGSSDISSPEGSKIVQVIWGGLYLVIFYQIYRRRRVVLSRLRIAPVLILLIQLAFLSTVWSEFPGMTLRRAVAVFCTSAVGFYAAIAFPLDRMLRTLAWSMLIAAIASLFVVFVFPQYSMTSGPRFNAWSGIFGHKNHLGAAMAVGILSWFAQALRVHGWARVGAFAATTFCLLIFYKSHSATSKAVLVCTLVFIAILVISHWTPSSSTVWFTLLVSLAIIWGVLLLDFRLEEVDRFMQTFARRDVTLTGRTVLWYFLWEDIKQRPLFGYGYSAYWVGNRGPSEEIWLLLRQQGVYDEPTHSHNGLIDLAVSLGGVGILLFLWQTVVMFWRSLQLTRKARYIEDFAPLLIVLVFISFNMAERKILLQHSLLWMLYCMCAFLLMPPTRVIKDTQIQEQQ